MSQIPPTSISLIKALACDPQSKRWEELYAIYERPMRGFLQKNFPSVEPDDALQETMLALMKALPNYCYAPDEKGHFHNYLTGILKHKAMDAQAAAARTKEVQLCAELAQRSAAVPSKDEQWKNDALEVAIAQLLSNKEINPFHRTVFEHLVKRHEKPEQIARLLGTSRSNVDVIKKRMLARLTAIFKKLIAS